MPIDGRVATGACPRDNPRDDERELRVIDGTSEEGDR